jgi:hypothetical protein
MVMPTPSTPEPPDMPAANPEPTEPSSILIESCTQIGGYDRVFVFQRDAATSVCTFVGLVSPVDREARFDLTSVSLPERWTVENMEAFACTPEGEAVSGAALTYYTSAVGSIGFAGGQGGMPARMKLDVVLRVPDETVGTPANEMIAEQRIVAEDLEVLGSCTSSF